MHGVCHYCIYNLTYRFPRVISKILSTCVNPSMACLTSKTIKSTHSSPLQPSEPSNIYIILLTHKLPLLTNLDTLSSNPT